MCSKEYLRGLCMNLWEWSSSCHGDLRMLETLEPCNICPRKFLVWNGDGSRRHCGQQEAELGDRGYPTPLEDIISTQSLKSDMEFQSCFIQIIPCNTSIFLLCNGNVHSVSLYAGHTYIDDGCCCCCCCSCCCSCCYSCSCCKIALSCSRNF